MQYTIDVPCWCSLASIMSQSTAGSSHLCFIYPQSTVSNLRSLYFSLVGSWLGSKLQSLAAHSLD